jgi:hypothetical protein
MITFAVFHRDRLFYLKNCVQSILEFVGLDGIKLLVVDNNSSEDGVHEYLSSLPGEVEVKQYTDHTPHELHRAMNYAISYSRKCNSPYVNFIQDDYQYLYTHPNLLSLVCDAFNAQGNVVQVQTNMGWRRKNRRLGRTSIINVKGMKWRMLHKKPPCDNGFTRVSLYKKIGMYPESVSIHGREKGYKSGESWFRHKCKKYRRMMIAKPNMGMLMDCAYVRNGCRLGRYFAPVNKYYLKPFDETKIKIVETKASNNEFCFIEDLIEPDGWKPDSMKKHSDRNVKTVL